MVISRGAFWNLLALQNLLFCVYDDETGDKNPPNAPVERKDAK